MQNLEQTVTKLIDKAATAFISSIDEQGFPTIKAMLAPRKREELKTFYFTTNTSSQRVKQYLNNNKACIYFCDEQSFQGVMFQGTIEVLQDLESKKIIWREGDTMYYSQGVTDPDYCVLKFTAQNGRYYSDFTSKDFSVK